MVPVNEPPIKYEWIRADRTEVSLWELMNKGGNAIKVALCIRMDAKGFFLIHRKDLGV